MKALQILLVSMVLSMGSVYADDAVDQTIGRTFDSSIIQSAELKANKITIKLKTPDVMTNYFTTGDKANKVFAIDSCRLLRNNPDLKHISIWLPMPDGMRVMSVSRKEIEDYYGVDFAAMKDNMDLWRESFVLVYDNKESRQRFVDRFVEVR